VKEASARLGSIASLVERVSKNAPERPALDAPGRAPLGYGDLLSHVGSVTAELRERGLEQHDRVALLVENGPAAASAFLVLASAAACAPLNPAYRRAELDFYLDDLDPRAVVVSRRVDSPVRDAATARGIAVLELDDDPATPSGTFTLGGPSLGPPGRRLPALDDVALLLHTSGTTARPKLVPLTDRNLLASARSVAATLALAPGDRCLNVMPLFHIHGLVAALLASLDAGASVVCTPGFHPLRVFEWFAAAEATWLTAVPTMHSAVLARSGDHQEVLASHRLRFLRSSSAPLPVRVLEELEQSFGVPVIEAYGMTEAAHQMASNPLPPGARRPGSVGRASGPEIAVLAPDGEPVSTGSVGEVAIRGDSVFSGYVENAEANASAFIDGWFRTGDQGVLDADGYLTLIGRLKEQINRGGEKIAPVEVDVRLLAHHAVAEAVTFAMPHAMLGEEVAAAVVLQSGAQAPESALQDFVAQTLAPFKVPRRIVFLEELPKGPTGKIQRLGLAERLGLPDAGAQAVGHADPRTTFERSLAEVWANVLGVPSVGLHDDFFSLGGDSILGAEAVARIRELTGEEQLPLVSIVRAPTVAGMTRELYGDISALQQWGPVELRPRARGGAPFFFVHGGDGEVLNFVALARAIGAERNVWGIRARGIDDGLQPHDSIEGMAADYVRAMRSVQPEGPYALGGFCLGATVALEMARLLVAVGDEISALVLVDPRLPRPSGLRYQLWIARRRDAAAWRQALRGRLVRRGARKDPMEEGPSAIERSIARAREAYRPREHESSAVLILSDEHEQYGIPRWHLARVLPQARTVRLELDHTPMLRVPGVRLLAREVRIALGLDGTVAT
jgi:oxalate---CoA ligase